MSWITEIKSDKELEKAESSVCAGEISTGTRTRSERLIAGICVANHLKLLTGNKKHFQSIDGLVLI